MQVASFPVDSCGYCTTNFRHRRLFIDDVKYFSFAVALAGVEHSNFDAIREDKRAGVTWLAAAHRIENRSIELYRIRRTGRHHGLTFAAISI